MRKLVPPLANLNGNNYPDLKTKALAIIDALRAVDKVIANGSDLWHGRNYQHIAGPKHYEAVDAAQNAWRDRRAWLNDFETDVMDMVLEMQAKHNGR